MYNVYGILIWYYHTIYRINTVILYIKGIYYTCRYNIISKRLGSYFTINIIFIKLFNSKIYIKKNYK